jgi:hypothetical protein
MGNMKKKVKLRHFNLVSNLRDKTLRIDSVRVLDMCYILWTTRSNVYVALGTQGACRGVEPPCVGIWGKHPRFFSSVFVSIFGRSLIFVYIHGRFFSTWFFADGFLFSVKELGLLTNPGHWIRVLDAAGSYIFILL